MHTNTTNTTSTTTDFTINDTDTHITDEYKYFNSDKPAHEDVETSLLSFFSPPSTSIFCSSTPLFSDEDAQTPYTPTVIEPRLINRSDSQMLQQPLEVNAPGTPTIQDENSQTGEPASIMTEDNNGNGNNVVVGNFQLFDVINQVHLKTI